MNRTMVWAPSRPPSPGGISAWSLRMRLVAAMIGLLALGCLVVGATTEVALRTSLYDRLDTQLTGAAGRAAHAFQPEQTVAAPAMPDCTVPHDGDSGRGQNIGTLVARFCGADVDAEVITELGATAPDLGAVLATLRAVPPGAAPRTVDLSGLGDYRVVAGVAPDGAVFVTGLPLADTHATLYLVAGVVGGVTVVTMIAVGLVGAVIVRRTLRPLSRVAATATRVSELPLDHGHVDLAQRVPDADTDPRTEVGQVGAALNRMLDHVGTALERRHASETQVRQFVADASHELRTPLAAIRGYAELRRRSHTPLTPETTHVLHRIETETARMTTLVEDLLLLARLDAGRPLAHDPVDLSALAIDTLGTAHAAGPHHRWRLDLPEHPVTVTGDPQRLHQVLTNLLTNARTHTPEGTTVVLSVTTTGDRARVHVTDHGPGIDPRLLPHIFERFARGDTSRSRAAGSTGLGLSIVHAVVTAHHGTVTATSRPGHTTFTIDLPRSAAPLVRATHSEHTAAG